MKYLKILVLILIFATCFSCKKGDDIYVKKATLVWQGNYAVDGCGFFIKTGFKMYKPKNESIIDKSYESINGIRVDVQYKLLDENIEFYCGMSTTPMKNVGEIEIISIKKI